MARLRRRLGWLAGDRGSVSVIAAAIAFPAVLALLAAFFQGALWYAARNTALAAAQQGADVARGTGGSVAQGETAACSFARDAGGGMLRAPACSGSGGNTITITVCGNAVRLLALFPVHACEQAQGARERFTTRTQP
jgi:hypothetical protein